MDPKKVIAVFFVLAFVGIAIGYSVTGTYLDNPDGEYNYSGERAMSFEGKAGAGTVRPSEGNAFYIVNITLRNNDFESGIPTSAIKLIWILHLDSQRMSVNILDTELHPAYNSGVTVGVGKTVNYTVVFEIPENAIIDNPTLSYNYLSKDEALYLRHNPNLPL